MDPAYGRAALSTRIVTPVEADPGAHRLKVETLLAGRVHRTFFISVSKKDGRTTVDQDGEEVATGFLDVQGALSGARRSSRFLWQGLDLQTLLHDHFHGA